MKDIKVYAITDVGMVREANEDSYFVKDYGDMVVLTVADGMGGHIGGKTASTTAVKTIEKEFNKYRKDLPTEELMVRTMRKAHERIKEKSKGLPPGKSMGTTCTMSVIKDKGEVYLAHVGDSKLFQIRDDMIVQQSEDHTWVAAMIKAGVMSEEEAKQSENRNVITRSLGAGKDVKIDPAKKIDMKKGDILLLCSDGLTGYLTKDEILKIIKGTKDIKSAGKYMVELAKSRGGDDNITVIIAEYGRYKRDKNIRLDKIGKLRKPGGKNIKPFLLIILIIMLIVLVGLLLFVLKEENMITRKSQPKNQKQIHQKMKAKNLIDKKEKINKQKEEMNIKKNEKKENYSESVKEKTKNK